MSIQTHRVSCSLLLATILFFTGLDRPAWAGNGVWTPVGPGTGEIVSVTIHPGSPGDVWVGMPLGGLYRSSDQGANWRWGGGPFIRHGAPALAADPSHPAALWAATDSAVFRTEDGGTHWTKISDESYSTTSLDEPQGLVTVPGALYVVTRTRVLASTDGGRSWDALYDSSGYDIESFGAASARILYLAVYSQPGLRQSLDGGQTWATVASCPPDVRQIVLTPAAVYVAVGGDAAGLLRSTDQGRTWRPVLGGTRSRPFEVWSVAVDPREPRTFYVAGRALQGPGLWVSRNAGGSWTKAGDSTFSQLQFDSSAGTLYGNYYGYSVKRSLDRGVSWTTVLQAPSAEWSEAARIKFRPGDPVRAALAVGFTLYRSVNGGATWKLSNLPYQGPYDVDLDPSDPNRLLVSTDGGVYVSEDAGRTWRWAVGSGWSMRYLEILVRVDAQTLLTGGAGMFRSGDNGRSWQNVLPAWPTDSDATRWVQKIEADPVHPSTVYALAFVAELDSLPHGPLAGLGVPSFLWRSTDSGKTWKKVTQDLSTFAVDPASSRLYGVRGRQLLASDDGGKTWRQAGQVPGPWWDLVIDPRNPSVFYASPTLWRSRDRGVTWTLVNDQWSPAVLTIDPRDSRVLYGADSYSVYTITVPD